MLMLEKRIEKLIHAFTVKPPTHNAHRKVLPTEAKTESSCRFI